MNIKLKVKTPLLRDYLRHLFKIDNRDCVKLTLSHDFGRMAVGLYKLSEVPVDTQDDDRTITLTLPSHKTTNAALTKYVFYTDADTQRLNYILNALFNIDLDIFYLEGLKTGLSKCDIIDAFMEDRGLVSFDYTDTLTKRTYRAELATIRKKRESLHRKVRYNLSQIQPTTASSRTEN